MSLDCLIIAKLCGIKNGYYEVADLSQSGSKTRGSSIILPFIIKYLEKLLLRNILGLVLTSRYFYYGYFKEEGIVPKRNIYIIDNKVNQRLMNQRPVDKRISDGRIVIGLIGLLRYSRSIDLLLRFVKERSESYIIECFGDGRLRGVVESNVCENIRYHGSFKNPEQLADIYAMIDLNYAVYDHQIKGDRLALPNKLFESAYFGVPIVCCQQTSVGKTAIEWQIGKMVRIDNKQDFEQDLGSIDKKTLQLWSQNCLKMANSELLDNGAETLRNMILKGTSRNL